MLQNAYFLAKIGADTAENEQHFAEIFGQPTLSDVSAVRSSSWCAEKELEDGERVQESAVEVPRIRSEVNNFEK